MEKLKQQLASYFQAYYKGLETNHDEDFPLLESNFYVHVKKALHLFSKSKFQIKVVKKDQLFNDKNYKEDVKIFERFHIMGINVERAKNGSVDEYNLQRFHENKGFIGYTYRPKEDFGIKEEKDASPKQFPTDGKVLIKPQKQLVLRIYVQYTSPYFVQVSHNGQDLVSETDYSFRHVGIFENQLRTPPVSATMFTNVEDWLSLYRLQKWKLVDFDGQLNGNPHIVDKAKRGKLVLAVPENVKKP